MSERVGVNHRRGERNFMCINIRGGDKFSPRSTQGDKS